jgi:hypothetical protein
MELRSIIVCGVDTRDGATYFAGRVWGVNTRYDLGGDHPLVGHSAPNFEFEDGATIGEHMREGMLLDFNRNTSLETLASEYGDRIKYVSGRATEQLGLSTVLIRPDGFIAWASDKEPDDQSIRQAVALWFGAGARKAAA